jgi:hypothetical protein
MGLSMACALLTEKSQDLRWTRENGLAKEK